MENPSTMSSSTRGSLFFLRLLGGRWGFSRTTVSSSSPLSGPSRRSALPSLWACMRWARLLRLFRCFTSTSMTQTLQPFRRWRRRSADIATVHYQQQHHLELWRTRHPVLHGLSHHRGGPRHIARPHQQHTQTTPYTGSNAKTEFYRINNIYNGHDTASQYNVKCRDARAPPCGRNRKRRKSPNCQPDGPKLHYGARRCETVGARTRCESAVCQHRRTDSLVLHAEKIFIT